MAKKQKYYVIWAGHQKGIFDSWAETEKNIKGYAGAQYKSFESKAEAESAAKKIIGPAFLLLLRRKHLV